MPKSLDDVKSVLMKTDDGVELYDVVSNAILQERNKGKGLVKDTQQKLDSMQGALTKLEFDPGTTDVSSFVDGLKDKLEEAKTNGKKLTKDEAIKTLQKSVETLTTKLAHTEEAHTKEKQEKQKMIISDAVYKGLKGKLYGADAHVVKILAEGLARLEDDGKTIVFSDGSEFKAGIEKYIQDHPEDIINAQKSGSEGGPSNGSAGKKTIKRSAFDKMTIEDRSQFFKDGGVLVD